MATREENIKKINEELEKLDDEQLEKIAGGWTDIRNDMAMTKNPLYDKSEFQSKVPTYQPGVIIG